MRLKIDGLAYRGFGVGRHEGKVFFVPFAAPGDEAICSIRKDHGRYAVADMLEVIQPSRERIEPPCPLYGACGGCQIQHIHYERQLFWKKEWIRESFQRIGRITDVNIEDPMSSPREFDYRNKASVHVAGESVGFVRMETRNVVDVEQCLLLEPELKDCYHTVREWVRWRGDRPDSYRILLRNATSGKGLVVVHDPRVGEQELSHLREALPGFFVIRPGDHATMGYSCLSAQFQVAAESFFQINSSMHEEMARLVGEMVGHGQVLVDAHAGVGWPSICLSSQFREVVGVEISRRSVDLANMNAKNAGAANARFMRGTIGGLMRKRKLPTRPDVLILDPPRIGLARPDLKAALALKPSRLVYMACDPVTLARDVAHLVAGGYGIDRTKPVDLFPQTFHVECLTVLTRKR